MAVYSNSMIALTTSQTTGTDQNRGTIAAERGRNQAASKIGPLASHSRDGQAAVAYLLQLLVELIPPIAATVAGYDTIGAFVFWAGFLVGHVAVNSTNTIPG